PTREDGVRKFEIGARLGVALPMGHFVGDSAGATMTSLSDAFVAEIPILIEAGYDVTPSLMLGIHVQYGGLIDKTGDGTACPSGVSCSDHDIELGIEGQYHFAPSERIDAWVGLGFGYEQESETVSFEGQSQDYSLEGPQFLKLQGGTDFRISGLMTVGPFLSFSLAEYTKATNDGQSTDVPSKAVHEWLSLGVKGTFKIGD
ncbi:MAG TPA: hypothetical protein VHW01_09555, partial [Polyangiaceae bacterium]|nr:hypothetical protein [Polyangiaceae bacterium]